MRIDVDLANISLRLIEETTRRLDMYGLALTMIRAGCADPEGLARDTLKRAWNDESAPPPPEKCPTH